MIRIGISGWTYAPWRGEFYPAGLPHRRELAYAAERLTSIEINGTFYALQRPSSFARWADEAPADFVFTVKGPRFVTHMKKLNDVAATVANFFASGPLALGRKLGPILWQLPPTLGFDPDRLTAFFDLLPRTQAAAAELAGRHDHRLSEEQVLVTATAPDEPVRHALEVRHDSFKDPAVLDLLRAHDVAIVVADTAGKWPQLEEVTADFGYVRLHGNEELYVSGYDESALDSWLTKITQWHRQVDDVFVFFDNDVKVRAPYDAMRLIEKIAAASVS